MFASGCLFYGRHQTSSTLKALVKRLLSFQSVKTVNTKFIPTILCGGAGSRLWPVSREHHPKPFIRLADGQSLLQKAFLRGALLPQTAEVLTVTNREFFFKTEDELKEVNAAALATSFILEPFGRNTAAAIAAAALQVAERHGADNGRVARIIMASTVLAFGSFTLIAWGFGGHLG